MCEMVADSADGVEKSCKTSAGKAAAHMLGLQRYRRVVAALVEVVWDAGGRGGGAGGRCRLCRRR